MDRDEASLVLQTLFNHHYGETAPGGVQDHKRFVSLGEVKLRLNNNQDRLALRRNNDLRRDAVVGAFDYERLWASEHDAAQNSSS